MPSQLSQKPTSKAPAEPHKAHRCTHESADEAVLDDQCVHCHEVSCQGLTTGQRLVQGRVVELFCSTNTAGLIVKLSSCPGLATRGALSCLERGGQRSGRASLTLLAKAQFVPLTTHLEDVELLRAYECEGAFPEGQLCGLGDQKCIELVRVKRQTV